MPEKAAPPTAPERREAIIRAATELFANESFHGVGMRAIADEVGIRSSSLYHHFPSKMDLLDAIATDATQQFVETHLPMLEGDGSRADRLRRLLEEHILYYWEHRTEEYVGLRELRQLAPERRERVNDIRLRYQHALEQCIRDGKKAGEFDPPDPHITTLAVLNMVNGVNDWFHPGGKLSIKQVARAYADIAVDRIIGAQAP
ncbi:MAG: TetR family transcriptional regulator [Solirubrobacteraceae bacterium]|nr:TetR family transcriptional regulator [Solirubrobacteraceae bacterium]